ncbi:MAG: hypothetical protein AB7O39_03130 [Flavobacteriaceae bacterium]
MRITRFKIGADCLNAAMEATGGRLSRDQIEDAFNEVAQYKQRLQAEGGTDRMGERLKSFAEREAERTRIAAAMQRRHAALNILVRDRLDQHVTGLINQGMTPRKALLAVFEGTQKGVEGGRNSVAALTGAYEARYLGGLFAEIQANRPHLIHALRDPAMDTDITIEMAELREGGKPGITGNEDAKYIAKVFSTYAELSRTDLNKLGASIGKLDGWSGAQTHDDVKMIAAGKDAWIESVWTKLDMARTFPDVENGDQIKDALSDIYDTIITGLPNKPTPRELGQRVNPANLAKRLGKSRVLHFKDAESALAYRAEFGYGNTVSGMIGHLRNSARFAANMEALGPNPEVMFGSLVDGLKRKIKEDPKLSDAQKQKQIASLTLDAGPLRQAIDIASGLVSRPVKVTAAKIGSDIRAAQSMAKLGGAVISSVSDTVTAGAASQFRGSGFFKGFTAQIEGMMRGRPKGERAEISFLVGEGFDGLIGHIVAPAAAVDGPVGRLSKLQETFFRWNGLTWWTDIQRASAGRVIAAEMGMRAKTSFADLPANYRHVLGLHSITEAKWEAIRKAGAREVEGKAYITPERIRDADDSSIEPLVAERIAAARTSLKVDEAKTPETKAKREAQFAERRAGIIEDGRRDLELSVLRFFADETSYGVVEVDARSRRTMTLGMRPGTIGGEAMRFIGQFKGFPMAFAQRVGGRALFGHRKDASILERTAHIGTLLAGMTMAGYAAMTMKDVARGYWPPRDPSKPETWAAAFIQGGAAGIYGDFLFGRVNRFGGGLAETAMGPTFGATFDLADMALRARDAGLSSEEEFRFAELVNFATQNTPYANLFYVRPSLDYLFLNSLREATSPGFTRRVQGRRKSDYGQESYFPKPLTPFN